MNFAIEKPQRRFTPEEVMDLLPNAVFSWYALQVVGGQENIAAAHLAGRRFGVYLPIELVTGIVNGRKIIRCNPLLPGYLFVSTWAINRHWRRIADTPGAVEILGGHESPRQITPDEIHRINVLENTQFSLKLNETEAVYRGRRRRRRRSRRARIDRAIDKQRQISALKQELGLEQRHPTGSSRLEGRGFRVEATVPRAPENLTS